MCYGPTLVQRGRNTRTARLVAVALLLTVSAVPALSGVAASEESIEDMKARMAGIQARLDAATAKIEQLHAQEEDLENQIHDLGTRIGTLEKRRTKLRVVVAERADELYRSGGTGMVEVLFGSESFSELQDRAEILSQVSLDDAGAFVEMAHLQAELEALESDLTDKQKRLAAASAEYKDEAARQQSLFDSVAADLQRLQAQILAASPSVPTVQPVQAGPAIPSVNGKVCPLGQPRSFIDSWGYPRSGGRSHEGVDMMSSYGTPIYAIVSGTITYAGYGDSAGNWQILSGSDGNAYWYMHNQSNIVTGGAVKVGQQIATVGDTGNAAGAPHLHFEYHPGGGGPVNPYPLVAAVC